MSRDREKGQTELFMDKEVGTDGRTEAPGSLLWLSTKLPRVSPVLKSCILKVWFPTRRWAL